MVFVTLGNQDFQFKRLMEAVEKAVLEGVITSEVVAQIGHTKFDSDKIRTIRFLSKNEFDEYMKNAEFIITHCGTGSIINGIRNQKKVIVAARQKKFGEHIDDHQLELLEAFTHKKYIIPLNENLSDLNEKIEKLDEIQLEKYYSNTEKFNERLISRINQF